MLDREDAVSRKSLGNLTDVHVLPSDQLNAYDVLCADDVVFTRQALDTFLSSSVVTNVTGKESDQ